MEVCVVLPCSDQPSHNQKDTATSKIEFVNTRQLSAVDSGRRLCLRIIISIKGCNVSFSSFTFNDHGKQNIQHYKILSVSDIIMRIIYYNVKA